MRFRKKPVVIDAKQFLAADMYQRAKEIQLWAACAEPRGEITIRTSEAELVSLLIDTMEGEMTAREGDWIIRGVQGEFYPCKPDIFAATYEAVEEAVEPAPSPAAVPVRVNG